MHPILKNEKPAGINRRLWWPVAGLALAALVLSLLLPRNAGAYRAMPSQSAIVLEFNGLLKTAGLTDTLNAAPWKSLRQSAMLKQCFQDGERMIKLLGKQKDLAKSFFSQKLLAAYTLNDADSLQALYALELSSGPDLKKLLEANAASPKVFRRQFHGHEVYTLYYAKNNQIDVAYTDGLLLYSKKATLVEDALAQLSQVDNWWSRQPLVSRLPDAPFRFFLRPSAAAEQWRGKMSARWVPLPDLLARNIDCIGTTWDGAKFNAQ